jgi:hypothetical protein
MVLVRGGRVKDLALASATTSCAARSTRRAWRNAAAPARSTASSAEGRRGLT